MHHHRTRPAAVEPLEPRQLLSTTPMRAHPASGGAMTATPAFAAGNPSVVGFTPGQVRAAYGLTNIRFGSVVGDGTGQTIAIVVAYDNPRLVSSTDAAFATSDLAQFDTALGLASPPSFTKVNQAGSATSLPAADPTGGGWANEAALDVEWAHAAAPAASLLLVECDSDNLTDLLQGGANYARSVPGVSVVSMSFAAPEAATEVQFDPYLTTPAGHAGVTFVAAAGDAGLPAEYPAASPNVVGVGGTAVTLSGNAYVSETGLANGGGGVSLYEPKPGFQHALTQSADHRATPDVAFAANHDTTGFAVYDSFNGGASTPWYAVGGTSYATPIWAALIATANQGRARLGLPTMDSASQTLPRLYYLSSSDFHDVTTGNNGAAAGTGYDLVTGRGTPIANTLVPNLAGGASIAGTEFQDTNRNGTVDAGDAGIAAAGVFLDLYHTAALAGIDPLVTTTATGGYGIGDLPGGTYRLASVGLTSYTKTTPTYVTITVGYGTAVTNQNIGQHLDLGAIAGTAYIDQNNNRAHDGSETAGLAGRTIYLDDNDNGVYDAGDTQTTTSATGTYTFGGLRLGRVYYVRQDVPAGYSRTTLAGGAAVSVALFGGTTTVDIGYVPNTASVSGTVFSDANGNGTQDAGEPALNGFGAFLDLNRDGSYTAGVDLRVLSDTSGHFTIGGLAPGTYLLNEAVVPGYRRTAVGTVGYTVVVGVAAAVTGKNFGNQPV